MNYQQNNPIRPTIPLLYQITNRQAFLHKTEPGLNKADSAQPTVRLQLEAIRQAAAAGCQLIQIREKDLSARALAEFTRQAIAVARPLGAKVLVNDRLDVAIAANADGVHLRVSSLPVKEVSHFAKTIHRRGAKNTEEAQRNSTPLCETSAELCTSAVKESPDTISQLLRKEFLIGVSTHSLAEAQAAANGGADFIVCGPVYDTPSKREFGEPFGLERFAEVCRTIRIPVLALGGINLSNFRQPLENGAAGIAAISLFNDAENLSQLFAELRQTLAGY